MLITLLSTVLCAATTGLLGFAFLNGNDYFFHSGTRAPNELDFLIVIGFLLLPFIGAITGFILGQKLHSEGKTISVFLTTKYAIIPLLCIALLVAVFALNAAIAKRDAAPLPQNEALVAQLESTTWNRKASDSEMDSLSKSVCNQIVKISFGKHGSEKCPRVAGEYTLTYKSGVQEQGCWFIAPNSKNLGLGMQDGYTQGYNEVNIVNNTLSLESSGQKWLFTKVMDEN